MSKFSAMSKIGIHLSYFAFKLFIAKVWFSSKTWVQKSSTGYCCFKFSVKIQEEYRNMLKAICQKFHERSPLNLQLLHLQLLFLDVTWLQVQKSLLKGLKNWQIIYMKGSTFPLCNVMILKVSTASFLGMLSK